MHLRVAIIGHEEAHEIKTSNPYTLYRTIVVDEEGSHERLIRYRQFHKFFHNLAYHDRKHVTQKFPKRRLRKSSNFRETVLKQRVHDLDLILKQLVQSTLSEKGLDDLYKLLMIGKYKCEVLMKVDSKTLQTGNLAYGLPEVPSNPYDQFSIPSPENQELHDNKEVNPYEQLIHHQTSKIHSIMSNDGTLSTASENQLNSITSMEEIESTISKQQERISQLLSRDNQQFHQAEDYLKQNKLDEEPVEEARILSVD